MWTKYAERVLTKRHKVVQQNEISIFKFLPDTSELL